MKITPRQEELLRLLARGFENSQCAVRMNISDSSVERLRKQIMLRTRSRTAVHLGVWLTEHGYHLSKPASPSTSARTPSCGAVAATATAAGEAVL